MNPARTLVRIPAKLVLAFTCLIALAAPCALAQTQAEASKPANACQTSSGSFVTKVFNLTNYMPNVSFIPTVNFNSIHNAEDLQRVLRDVLCPGDKIELLLGQSAILVHVAPEELPLAEKIITELNRPKKTYRLTYTITELDAGKSTGTQHLSMVVVSGQQTTMKAGEKIPVATGATDKGAGLETQFTYLDIGMNFDSSIEEIGNGVRLQSKVEQSSLGQPSSIAGVQEPVVRQTVLEGTSFLTLGKPIMLGTVDVPNSTRHFDIAVVLSDIK